MALVKKAIIIFVAVTAIGFSCYIALEKIHAATMGILNKIPASFEGLESYEHYLEYMRDHINEMSFEKFKQYESHRLGEEAQRLKKAIIILKQLEAMNQLK